MKKKLKVIIPIIAGIILVAVAAFIIAMKNPYKPGEVAKDIIENGTSGVSVRQYDDYTVFIPYKKNKVGFIFYPGAFVEYDAYAPLLVSLAEKGVFCAVVRMPENLAFLDIDRAELIKEEYPDIPTWFVGGHSLGGAMVSEYLADNYEDYSGIIMLASYPSADLTDTGLPMLIVYGTEDGVLNRGALRRSEKKQPFYTTYYIINGGNHAQFGDYGKQLGDGVPNITAEKQISLTTDAMYDFISSNRP